MYPYIVQHDFIIFYIFFLNILLLFSVYRDEDLVI